MNWTERAARLSSANINAVTAVKVAVIAAAVAAMVAEGEK